jgi:hypothetical protein
MRSLHEQTRRRALLALAAAEQATDSFADAARTYQELERALVDGDPEGAKIRTLRLACALAAGDLAQSRALLTADSAEEQQRRLWGLVLERFLTDDLEGASAALKRARVAIPDAEPLLRGDVSLEQFFLEADLSPDVIATGILLAAWERNEGAQEWLAAQKRARR